jgi:dipeptidyl aminopeptidase/acylaminoacyl peptidase
MAELTPELIADLLFPEDLHISPDGAYVVYTLAPISKKEEHETSALWLALVDKSRPPRQFTSGDYHDHAPQWSPDGSSIAFLSDRSKRGTDQLYLIAADGGEARSLMPKEQKKPVNRFAWSPMGGQIAFTSADEPTEEDEKREKERDDAKVYGEKWPYARLRLLSLATGEITTRVSGDRHIADFAWHPRGTELAYVVQQTPDLESRAREMVIERVAVAGGEPQVICRFAGEINALTWSHDGEMLLCIAPVEAGIAQSSQAVYAVPAEGGEPRRLAGGETNCMMDLFSLQQDRQVAVSVAEGLETHLCRLETTTGEVTTFFPTAAEDRAADYIAWHARTLEDGRLALAVVRGAGKQPWEIWAGLVDNKSPVLHQLSTHQEQQLAGLIFAPLEPFYWTAPDGLHLDGILVRPPDAPKDRPAPTVVLVHGGPYWRFTQRFYLNWGAWAQWLALAGYAVLMPNPRGGMGHGERFAAAARGDVGGADYGDVMSAIDAAIERGVADPDRLGIGGWSQGGFMSAWAVTQTDRFKAAIMGAGVSDWGMMVMTSDVPGFERELGGSAPWEGLEIQQYRKLSPITFAHRVKTPVLIMHGEKDERVPLSQATGFHRALREHHVPTEFVVYPREPHGISERAHQIDVLRRVRTWYDRWLRP